MKNMTSPPQSSSANHDPLTATADLDPDVDFLSFRTDSNKSRSILLSGAFAGCGRWVLTRARLPPPHERLAVLRAESDDLHLTSTASDVGLVRQNDIVHERIEALRKGTHQMITTLTLDDYLAELTTALQELPERSATDFTCHFVASIQSAHERAETVAGLLYELADDIDSWATNGWCTAHDDDQYDGADTLCDHFTAWMCAREDNIQDDGMALVDIGVTALIGTNVHGPGCYITAAHSELDEIVRRLGAEHVVPDLDDLVAFIPSDLIDDLPTWPERIRRFDGWNVTETGDLFDEPDEPTSPDFNSRMLSTGSRPGDQG